MPIDSIMTANPVTIGPDATLAEARELIEKHQIHHLLVESHKRVVGLVSEVDILRNISPYANTPAETARDQFTLNKKIHQVMRRNPPTITPSDSVKTAAKIILEDHITCVPVVDNSGNLVGIVSWKDLLRFAMNR